MSFKYGHLCQQSISEVIFLGVCVLFLCLTKQKVCQTNCITIYVY